MKVLTRRKHRLIEDDHWTLLCQLRTHIDDFKKNGAYKDIELMAKGASGYSLTEDMFDKDFAEALYARVGNRSLIWI